MFHYAAGVLGFVSREQNDDGVKRGIGGLDALDRLREGVFPSSVQLGCGLGDPAALVAGSL